MNCRVNPWIRKIPWRRAWQPTPVFLPGESHGQRSLVCYIVRKVRIAQNQTQLKRLSNCLCRVQETLRFFFFPLQRRIKTFLAQGTFLATQSLRLHFQCRAHGFNPWLGDWDPKYPMMQPERLKKNKIKPGLNAVISTVQIIEKKKTEKVSA